MILDIKGILAERTKKTAEITYRRKRSSSSGESATRSAKQIQD